MCNSDVTRLGKGCRPLMTANRNGSDLSPRRKIFGRLSITAGNALQISGIVAACLALAAARSAHHRCCCRRGCGLGSPLFLLSCHCPLGGRANSWHSLRFLHGRRDRESRRLACWTPLVVRTSSFFWSADGEGLYAKGQPDCQSDYVVCGSDIFRRCPNPGCALGMVLWCPVEQVAFSGCAVLGGRNVGE